ncbi:MAG: hypothetical protein Q7J73_02365 [Dehalococcoidales bacterium]|nr:hypothetical protein [Dehalococcoidales bacterium]
MKGPAKPTSKKKVGKGNSIICKVCSLAVVIEQAGNIVVSQESALLCCGKPMQQKAGKARLHAK